MTQQNNNGQYDTTPPAPAHLEAGLARFGLQWNGPREFVSTPMVDGYWTPWHIAQSALTEAQKDRNAQYDRAQTVSQHNSRLWSEREALRNQLTAAQQRIADLHAALRTYGWHKPECDYMQEELPCTCGFLTAVERGFPEIGPLPTGEQP